MLSENDPAMGISTIFLYDEQYYLPNFCQYIVNVDDPYDDRTATAFYKYRADEKMWFTMDPPISQRKFDAFCRQMSAIEAEDAAARGQIFAYLPAMHGCKQGAGSERTGEMEKE